jgi:hypothetical protein
MIEPSDAEQETWSDVTCDYVRDLQIEIERLRKAIEDHIDYADWQYQDQINRGYTDVTNLRAALQPKEGQ